MILEFLKEYMRQNNMSKNNLREDVNTLEYIDTMKADLTNDIKKTEDDIRQIMKSKSAVVGSEQDDIVKKQLYDKQLKMAQDKLKNKKEMLSKTDATQKDFVDMDKKEKELETKEPIEEEGVALPKQEVQPQIEKPKKKSVLVNFDKNTDNPFSVKFSERGFTVNDTRMSFENLEIALSKNYNVVLDGGNGLVLDAVRMQKILKYKDRV